MNFMNRAKNKVIKVLIDDIEVVLKYIGHWEFNGQIIELFNVFNGEEFGFCHGTTVSKESLHKGGIKF